MGNSEKLLRLRTKCFEAYEDVCKNRQFLLMVPTNDLTQQVIPVILPSTDLLKKADNLLPPLFAPLGGQAKINPLILAPAIQILEPTTTKTSTTTSTTTTTVEPLITTTSPTTAIPSVNSTSYNEEIGNINDTINNETVIQTLNTTDDIDSIQIMSSESKPISTPQKPNYNSSQESLNTSAFAIAEIKDQTTTQKPSILVLNMEESPPSVIPPNSADDSKNNNVPIKTEYATIEYISNIGNKGDHEMASPPDVLIDEDSKSNSIHEEYHTKVLTDYDNAPQSLLQPDEPPENP